MQDNRPRTSACFDWFVPPSGAYRNYIRGLRLGHIFGHQRTPSVSLATSCADKSFIGLTCPPAGLMVFCNSARRESTAAPGCHLSNIAPATPKPKSSEITPSNDGCAPINRLTGVPVNRSPFEHQPQRSKPGPLMESKPQIARLVTEGFRSFKSLIQSLESHPDSPPQYRPLVSSYSMRYKLWVASLGAHRPSGTRSLEYKLRDASGIRDNVISLLQDLGAAITQGASLCEPQQPNLCLIEVELIFAD